MSEKDRISRIPCSCQYAPLHCRGFPLPNPRKWPMHQAFRQEPGKSVRVSRRPVVLAAITAAVLGLPLVGNQAENRGAPQPIGEPLTHAEPIHSLAVSPDGKLIATGAADNTARVWDAATGKPVTPPLPHED